MKKSIYRRFVDKNAMLLILIAVYSLIYDLVGFKLDYVVKVLSVAGISLITEALLTSLFVSLIKKRKFLNMVYFILTKLVNIAIRVQSYLIKNTYESDTQCMLLQSRDSYINGNIYTHGLIRNNKLKIRSKSNK